MPYFKVRNSYLEMMVKVMEVLGYEGSGVKLAMKNVLNFEIKLAKIQLTSTMLRKSDKVDKKVTLKQLTIMNPEVSFENFVEFFFLFFNDIFLLKTFKKVALSCFMGLEQYLDLILKTIPISYQYSSGYMVSLDIVFPPSPSYRRYLQ